MSPDHETDNTSTTQIVLCRWASAVAWGTYLVIAGAVLRLAPCLGGGSASESLEGMVPSTVGFTLISCLGWLLILRSAPGMENKAAHRIRVTVLMAAMLVEAGGSMLSYWVFSSASLQQLGFAALAAAALWILRKYWIEVSSWFNFSGQVNWNQLCLSIWIALALFVCGTLASMLFTFEPYSPGRVTVLAVKGISLLYCIIAYMGLVFEIGRSARFMAQGKQS